LLQVAKLGIYKIIICTISNLCDNMFLYKFRMKMEDTEHFFFCFVFYNIFLENYVIKEGCAIMFVFLLAAKATHFHVTISGHITCEEAISVPKSEI